MIDEYNHDTLADFTLAVALELVVDAGSWEPSRKATAHSPTTIAVAALFALREFTRDEKPLD